ncbi:hypothetical protein, partial [Nostoc sp. 'Peltigera malacea cyanobiont' DB3992]|uniref:hypothetical protein n=1 Tax=Nostoc sp. 'Peltigera malacea cyanobiont' DB3992 TaxID=1206980 RepID=UPI000C05D7D1
SLLNQFSLFQPPLAGWLLKLVLFVTLSPEQSFQPPLAGMVVETHPSITLAIKAFHTHNLAGLLKKSRIAN